MNFQRAAKEQWHTRLVQSALGPLSTATGNVMPPSSAADSMTIAHGLPSALSLVLNSTMAMVLLVAMLGRALLLPGTMGVSMKESTETLGWEGG